MYLVFDHVVQFQDVHVAHRDVLFEFLSGAAVVERHRAGFCKTRGLEFFAYLGLGDAREGRHDGLIAERMRRETEMHLEYLAEVHAGRDAERSEDDIYRLAVRVVRHVFDREHARDDALVAVAACELVTDRDVAELRDGDVDLLDGA